LDSVKHLPLTEKLYKKFIPRNYTCILHWNWRKQKWLLPDWNQTVSEWASVVSVKNIYIGRKSKIATTVVDTRKIINLNLNHFPETSISTKSNLSTWMNVEKSLLEVNVVATLKKKNAHGTLPFKLKKRCPSLQGRIYVLIIVTTRL
jgi:hypothetical protein